MNCKDVVGSLVDYLGESMNLQASHELEAHLEDCLDCQSFLKTYQETIALGRQLPLKEVPPGMGNGWRDHLGLKEGPNGQFEWGISKFVMPVDQEFWCDEERYPA